MWPNRTENVGTSTTPPGILSDAKETDLNELAYTMLNQTTTTTTTSGGANPDEHSNSKANSTSNTVEEFPILDELDRLAKMSRFHSEGHMIKQDWLDRLTLKEIQNSIKREKQSVSNAKFFFMTIEFAQ